MLLGILFGSEIYVLELDADGIFESHAFTGRNLLQAKKGLIFVDFINPN